MSSFPCQILSQAITDRIAGRKVKAALFLTYEFDPAFFEVEVLPTLFDEAYSHEAAVKLLQLEDAMRSLVAPIAVYYDRNGLRAEGGGSRLDVQRVPISHPTGIFHPKNVFVLVEGDADEDGERPTALLVVTLSANLTRTGWWENVECCHVEEIDAGAKTWLKEPLQKLLRKLRDRAAAQREQPALELVLEFLRRTEERERVSDSSRFVAFWHGEGQLVDFLNMQVGGWIEGCCLEVVSPFFDGGDSCKPLQSLIEKFEPKEVRVLLPEVDGVATCSPDIAKAIGAMPRVQWGELPSDLLRRGRSADAGTRRVHAKVYRFFRKSPMRELLFVGSANLTSQAFQNGGNWETGILVDVQPKRAPDFWLQVRSKPPTQFQPASEAGEAATNQGSPLQLRYHWDRGLAEAFWDSKQKGGALTVLAAGVVVGKLPALPVQQWCPLDSAFAASLREHLGSTSLLKVCDADGEERFVLVQEEGMQKRPSLLQSLSVADILRCWSLLTQEQRTAFLVERGHLLAGVDVRPPTRRLGATDSMFDRFAGIFHAFGGLERSVRKALEDAKHPGRDAEHRLFGCKHDSLGHLLDRALADAQMDDLSRYVLWLCAAQTWQTLQKEFPEFFAQHRQQAKDVEARFGKVDELRARLVAKDPQSMPAFLAWFEPHFRRRAEVPEATT